MIGLLGGGGGVGGILGDPQPQVARPAPVAPAIQGPVTLPVPSQPQRPRSLYDGVKEALGLALGGPQDPNLSAAQNDEAAKMGRIMGGLQMLASSYNPQGNAPGIGEIALQGALAGQGAAGQHRMQSYAATAEERVRQALEDPEIVGRLTPMQQRMIRLLPPQEAAQALMQMAFANPAEAKVVGSGGALVDPNTGQVIFQNEAADQALPGDLRAVLWGQGVDPDQLTPEQRQAALEQYQELKRSGATTVNIGEQNSQREFENVNTLASQFRTEVGEHQSVANSYSTIQAAAQDPSAAGDLSLIFAYMKMLDPGSVVRESEFATAANAGSIPERIRAQYNRVVNGERLSDEQRRDFVDRAHRLAAERQRQFKPIYKRYETRARARALDPVQIIFDPYEEAGFSGGPPPAPATSFPLFEDLPMEGQ